MQEEVYHMLLKSSSKNEGSKQKILCITHQLSRTGAPIVFLDLIRILQNAGYEITVISLMDGDLRKELEDLSIPVSIKDDFYHDREAFRPYAEGFDAVFCNTLIAYQPIHVLNGSETPVFWWLHEGEQYFEYFKTVLPDFSSLAPNIHVYSVGHYVRDVILRRYGVTTGILHFGVRDLYDVSAAQDNPSHVADVVDSNHSRVRFVISGTYSNVKGQDVLCEAIRLLPPALLNACEFLFCGNETTVDESVFSAVCALVADFPNVKKRPSLTHPEMMDVMRAMDFLIVPSRVEPLSAVAVEAMMLHKPCIITDICGIAHYLVDHYNALLCPPEDPSALADAIKEAVRLSNDRSEGSIYHHICERGRDIYDAYFSVDVFTSRVHALISGHEARTFRGFTHV